jgi:hypothetical protein
MINEEFPHIKVRDKCVNLSIDYILDDINIWNQDNCEELYPSEDDLSRGANAVIAGDNQHSALHLSKCSTKKNKYLVQYYPKHGYFEYPWDFEEQDLKSFKKTFGENFNEIEGSEVVYEVACMTKRELYFFMQGFKCGRIKANCLNDTFDEEEE